VESLLHCEGAAGAPSRQCREPGGHDPWTAQPGCGILRVGLDRGQSALRRRTLCIGIWAVGTHVVDAVVLAGGVDTGDIATELGVVHRPLLAVGGRPIVARVLSALRGASRIGKVALVAPSPVQAAAPADAVDARVEAGDSFVDNMARGVEAIIPGSDHLLVITGDLPLITPAAIDDFVRRSLASCAALCYSIIPKEASERQFPGGRRTYVRLREGAFTGGNGMVVARHLVQAHRALLDRLFTARKHPLKMASVLGIGFIAGLLTHRLTLPYIEARIGAVIGGRAAAIISTYAELGFDVDKLDDLYLCRRVAASSGSRL
jgi:GTP:adenosylcobinamide-phosphate guanylyltransferase